MIAAVGCGALLASRAATPAFIWLEGEAARTTFKANIAGWGRPQFLSASNWLHVSVEEDKVEKAVPDDGILLEYPFTAPKTGRYEVWNRIGFEFVRSPFDWRIDDGAWQTASPDELTTDLMELATWCEVAWLKLGDAGSDRRRASAADPPRQEARTTRASGSGSSTPPTPSASARGRFARTRSSSRARRAATPPTKRQRRWCSNSRRRSRPSAPA